MGNKMQLIFEMNTDRVSTKLSNIELHNSCPASSCSVRIVFVTNTQLHVLSEHAGCVVAADCNHKSDGTKMESDSESRTIS